ncbi:MAG TPA: TIGR02206 family membrane protein [Anaerolineales bacterium]|nr:TIGR02206 family membrane protein [Anaerolineales bacterium]
MNLTDWEKFFAGDYPGPAFELFGTTHLAALAYLLLLNLYLLRFRNADDKTRRTIRWRLALILLINEIAWHYWNYTAGLWTIQTMLPLQLCSLMVWFGALMLFTKSYRIYQFVYFLGIGAAIQALATPDLGIYGFPHFRFFQTFLSHGLIITSAIYMTFVEGFRPTWRSIIRVAIWTNIYVIAIYFLNITIGSNYLNLIAKPATPSLLDYLPDWPMYILYMELLGIITVLLLYLPFAVRDWYTKFITSRDSMSRLDRISK